MLTSGPPKAAPRRTRATDAFGPGSRASQRNRSTGSLSWKWSLTRELAYTQFKLKYTGSVLGYLWSLVKPMMLFGTLYLVFVYLLKIGAQIPDFPMQLLVGIIIYTFFAEATGAAVSSVAASGHLIRKAYFPRPILVVAGTLSATWTFLINIGLLVAIAAPFGLLHLGWRSFVIVPLVAELYLLVLGLSLLLSALFVFYRDIGHIWEVLLQVIFYGSAVVFPFDLIHGKILPTVIGINPVAQIIEDSRHAIVTPAAPWIAERTGLALFPIPLALVLVALGLGVWVFQRTSPRFAESL